MITHLITPKGLIPKENWRLLLWRYTPKYLKVALAEREWNGTPSVTTCNRCPREYIFKQIFPYAVDPESFAFAALGTMVHAILEDDDAAVFCEERMQFSMETKLSGMLDLAYVRNGKLCIDDYKTWGSYAVAKHMGMEEKTRPMLDYDGKPVLYKNSRKGKWTVGEARIEKYYVPNPEKAEKRDAEMQVNMYRIMLEYLIKIGTVKFPDIEGPKKVSDMKVFCIVRDGNTAVAKSRGIMSQTYAIPMKILPDEEVLEYFGSRAKYIKEYMDKYEYDNSEVILENPPRMGTARETLNGYLCRVTCPVAHLCKRCKEHPVEAERDLAIEELINPYSGQLK